MPRLIPSGAPTARDPHRFIWLGAAWRGLNWLVCGLAWFRPVWLLLGLLFGLGLSDLLSPALAGFGAAVWLGLARLGLRWLGIRLLVEVGLVFIRLAVLGLAWLVFLS